MRAWRKLPLTAQAAAAYAPRLEEGARRVGRGEGLGEC
jgi:hypothetical protein